MSISYGYYLPLSDKTFESVRFLAITPKLEGVGEAATQKSDKDGNPVWSVVCLVKCGDRTQDTETFTLNTSRKVAEDIAKTPEMAAVALLGLSAGKWSRNGSDRTDWSFSITGLRVL